MSGNDARPWHEADGASGGGREKPAHLELSLGVSMNASPLSRQRLADLTLQALRAGHTESRAIRTHIAESLGISFDARTVNAHAWALVDLQAKKKWMADYAIPGVDGLALHHLYRAMAWLGEELPAEQQAGATPFAPRTVKDLIEEQLFAARRDLFSELSVVFMDTTSLSFVGAGGASLGERGYSKDHRPDLMQMILGVVIDARPTGLLGDVARQHRRCRRAGAGDRSPAQPIRHRPGLRRGRSRHDLGRDHRGARGTRPGIRARRARAHRHAG